MKKLKKSIDPIKKARKNKEFSFASILARTAIRVGVMVFEKRSRQKISNVNLAKKLQISTNDVSVLIRGEKIIDVGTFKILIDVLDFTKEDLVWIFEIKT